MDLDKSILPDSNSSNPPKAARTYDKKVHGKRYSISEKLAIKALQGAGMTVSQAKPLTNATNMAIMRIWNDPELDDLSPNVVLKTKNSLGGLFYKRALGATLGITPEKIQQSSALQLATVAGIMTEKGRLMDGLSTENVSFRGIAQSLDNDRAKIMERINELGT